MSDGLERILFPGKIHFKSEGERKIAKFLEANSIKYRYEAGILINDSHDKARLWYLDFSFPEYACFLEYFGLAGKPDYDEGIKTKLATYKKMGMDVIPFYPSMFRDDWRKYIMTELERITLRRYDTLKSKRYWPPKEAKTSLDDGLKKGAQGSFFY